MNWPDAVAMVGSLWACVAMYAIWKKYGGKL